jgi:hypothetical protein
MNEKLNRRAFFARAAQITGLAIIAPTVVSSLISSKVSAQEKRRGAAPAAGGGALPLVDPNDSVAKAVKYVEDHNKSAESKGNHCATCGFYTKKEMRSGKEVGTCTIFAGKVVLANAWCASWNKKA